MWRKGAMLHAFWELGMPSREVVPLCAATRSEIRDKSDSTHDTYSAYPYGEHIDIGSTYLHTLSQGPQVPYLPDMVTTNVISRHQTESESESGLFLLMNHTNEHLHYSDLDKRQGADVLSVGRNL